MSSITLTPATPGGGSAGTLEPSTTFPLLQGARLPVTTVESIWAESSHTEGRHRTRYRPLNPTGEGAVAVKGATTAAFRSALNDFQALVAQTNRYGGTLTYTPTGGTAISYEIEEMNIGADVDLSEIRLSRGITEVPFTFECRPYGLLPEQTVSFTGGALTGPCDYIDLPDVQGHVSALGVLTLTDTSSQNRDFVEIGLEMDGYSSSSPTDLILSQPDLSATGLAGSSTSRSGSYSANIYRATLTSIPQSVVTTGSESHQGGRRIRARMYASSTTEYHIFARLAWRIGDGPWERNSWVRVPVGQWSEPSLGTITVPLGETWEGRIEAYSNAAAATDTLDVDVIFPMPTEVYAKASRLDSGGEQPPLVLSARDEFNQSAGSISGKTLPTGGTWAELGVGGFTVDATNDVASRTATADATPTIAYPSGASGMTNVAVQSAHARMTANVNGVYGGVAARFANMNNYVAVYLRSTGIANSGYVEMIKVVAGATTTLHSFPGFWTGAGASLSKYRWIWLQIDTYGRYEVWVSLDNTAWTPEPTFTGQDSVLATGGALASGYAGIFDYHTGATACTRRHDDFGVWVPPPTETYTAMFSGRRLRFTSEKTERENSTGTKFGAVPKFEGQRLLIPPAQREDRISRIAVLARRFDVDAGLPSDGLTDGMTATLTVRPRVLLTNS